MQTRQPTRWHLLSIDEQASMVSGLEYGGGEEDGEGESWLQYLFKSQIAINRPAGSRAKVSRVESSQVKSQIDHQSVTITIKTVS